MEENDYLFMQENGKRLYPSTFTRWLNKMLLEANIDHYSLHSLRHTNITLPIAAGVPIIPLRREWNASAQVSTIRDIYTYALRRMDRMAADKLVYFQAMKGPQRPKARAKRNYIRCRRTRHHGRIQARKSRNAEA